MRELREKTWWRLLAIVASDRRSMALAALLGAATVVCGIGLIATAAYIIASAALHPSIADLAVAIVGVRFFGVARGVFRYLERYISHGVTFRLLSRFRVWFYESVEPLAPAWLLQRHSGDLLSRVIGDVEALQHFYLRALAPPAVALLIASGVFIFVGSFDFGLALVVVAFLGLAGIGVPLLASYQSMGTGRRLTVARADLSACLVDGVQGIADLTAFGQAGRQRERAKLLSVEWADTQRRFARISALHGGLGNLLTSLCVWALLVAAIPLVSRGQLDGVYLPVLALAALASFEAVLPLPAAFQHWGTSVEAAHRLFEVADARPTVREPDSPSPMPVGLDLIVENLGFRYGPGEPRALDGVSLTVPKGGRVAIVGPSGAGKSTLAHLLLRFWEYEEGRILLGGRDLREFHHADLCQMISLVSQRTHLFNATIRENLLIARPGAADAELEAAAQRSQLHAFVQELPKGYDTWIGEQGLRLSGGERQRLAIARALLRDAPILIVDEAAANLDSLTEREVSQAFRAMMTGRTTLIITHRLVGLEDADEIVVLDAGRVVERGRHDELMQLDGRYRRMWDVQRTGFAAGDSGERSRAGDDAPRFP